MSQIGDSVTPRRLDSGVRRREGPNASTDSDSCSCFDCGSCSYCRSGSSSTSSRSREGVRRLLSCLSQPHHLCSPSDQVPARVRPVAVDGDPLLLRRLRNVLSSCRRNLDRCAEVVITSEQRKLRRSGLGAGDGSRTRDPEFGKLMLYQLSYSRGLEGELLTIGALTMTVRTHDIALSDLLQ